MLGTSIIFNHLAVAEPQNEITPIIQFFENLVLSFPDILIGLQRSERAKICLEWLKVSSIFLG